MTNNKDNPDPIGIRTPFTSTYGTASSYADKGKGGRTDQRNIMRKEQNTQDKRMFDIFEESPPPPGPVGNCKSVKHYAGPVKTKTFGSHMSPVQTANSCNITPRCDQLGLQESRKIQHEKASDRSGITDGGTNACANHTSAAVSIDRLNFFFRPASSTNRYKR